MYFHTMRPAHVIIVIVISFYWVKPSFGQSFFQSVSEISHSEETHLLEKFKLEQTGSKRMVVQRHLDLFNQGPFDLVSDATLASFPLQEKLCIYWQNAYELRHQQKYALALKLCDSVLVNLKLLTSYEKAEFYRFIGVTYHIWGDFSLALENLRRAKALYQKSESEIGQIVCAYNIANAYLGFHHLNEFENALSLFTSKYSDIIHRHPYYEGNFNTLYASREFLNDNYERAFEYTVENVLLYQELSDSSNISRASFNAAIVSDYIGYTDSTLYFLQISKEYNAGEAHPRAQIKRRISLMEFLSKDRYRSQVLALYDYASMDAYFEDIDGFLSKHENENLRLDYLRQKAVYLQELGQFKLLAKILDQENDILYDLISKDTLNSELINYKLELEKTKNAEFGYQKTIADNDRQQLALKVRQSRYWTLAFILIALLIIVIIVRRNIHFKRTQKIKYLKELEELKNKQLNEELRSTQLRLEEFRIQLLEKSKLIDEAKRNLNLSSEEQLAYYEKMSEMKILTDDDWYKFKKLFEFVHPNMKTFLYENNISLTEGELRILMLHRLKFDRKHMGDMLGIGSESIRKAVYRLKKTIEPRELELMLLEF